MINKIKWGSLLLGISLATSLAQADEIQLGEPAYGGSGCPANSASVTLSPDQGQLSVLFDEFVVEAGGENSRVARKSCNLAIPVHVPQGFSISIFKVDYRGYVYVPYGGRATLSSEYFLAGQRGPRSSMTFRGEADEDYIKSDDITARAMVWSKCGADVNLRVNTSMRVMTNRYKDEALATVDSIDVENGMIYHVKWRSCSGNNSPFDDWY